MFKDRRLGGLFFVMFGIICLLNVNYAVLRSARNALAVADLGGGASSIPWFELCGTMPGSVLMTLALTWALNRYSIRRIFFVVMAIFVGFFLGFTFGIYPLLTTGLFSKLMSMLFFVMAELWKIALLTVLFWGFINQFISMEIAKRFYAPLMLGGSIGTIVAGPLISLCTSDFLSHSSWSHSLNLMMGAVTLISAAAAYLFHLLSKQFTEQVQEIKQEGDRSSIWENFQVCFRSPYLMLLAWVTIADYIAYALGEVVFFDILKERYPDPREYCDFMGSLSLWNGILTAISALFITPLLLRKCRWVVASLVTPICLLVTEGAFFFALCHPEAQIELLVVLGSIFFCLVRAAKYTLFDTSKELSFILLSPLEKMQGKLVIDGMCARMGRGSASFLSLMLIQMCGSVLATIPIAGGLALLISTSCVFATSKLGSLVEQKKLSS
jgi:AAA family ATP:ADP antiporter